MTGITDEQVEAARAVDVLDYLRTHEPGAVRKTGPNEYCLKEHDSLKISNGKFHWFSRGIGGTSALDFLVKVRGLSFAEAVTALADNRTASYTARRSPAKIAQAKPPKPFVLPPANINNDRAIAYLRGRGVDRDIIRRCIDSGILYEAAKASNCVFVGYESDKARFACERGTTDDFKRDVTGSDKAFSFVLPPKDPDSRDLAVLESPIDALSLATIHKLNGDTWDGHCLSLGGVSSKALMGFLERNPAIERITLCLDNDKAGREATDRIIKALLGDKRFRHLKIAVMPPPIGKDMGDTLQAIHERNRELSRNTRQQQAGVSL